MPEQHPKAQIDLEDLAIHEGAPVLLRRSLAGLAVGECLEVRADPPEFAEVLPAWCRKEGHCYLGSAGPRSYRIEKGAGTAPVIVTGNQVVESADPSWGLAPRGGQIEQGGPKFAFTLRQKREVWAQELERIYKQGVANQWSAARDIPWDKLPNLPREVEAAVAQIMTFLT